MAAVTSQATATPQSFHIAIPPPELAQDAALVQHLVQLINEVYKIAEAGIFDESYLRTNIEEITKYIALGRLALASNKPSSPWSSPSNVQGCIRIVPLSETEGELGMLVTSPASRGSGLGKRLMLFGEDQCRSWGAQTTRLDLLLPTTFRHEVKAWLGPWYERLGYGIAGVSDFRLTYPKLADQVIVETEYRMFRKVL